MKIEMMMMMMMQGGGRFEWLRGLLHESSSGASEHSSFAHELRTDSIYLGLFDQSPHFHSN